MAMYLELVICLSCIIISSVVTLTSHNTTFCKCVPYYMCKRFQEERGDSPCDDLLFCCETKYISPTIPKQNSENLKQCGRLNPIGVGFETVRAGNGVTHFGELPWMTALIQKPQNATQPFIYQCGASLIHPQVVLTAAHCIRNNTNQFKVRVGEWDTQTDKEVYPHQERDVKTIIVHPNYNRNFLFFDVALLILDSPVQIEEHVNVVCLPDVNTVIDNFSCYSSGWGKHNFGSKGKFSAPLKKVKLSVVDNKTCQENLRNTRLGNTFILDDSFLCAVGRPGEDRCTGYDSGSPLICLRSGHENKYFQVGIVAWAVNCADNLMPAVYANVSKIINWIDEIMIDNKFEMSYKN